MALSPPPELSTFAPPPSKGLRPPCLPIPIAARRAPMLLIFNKPLAMTPSRRVVSVGSHCVKFLTLSGSRSKDLVFIALTHGPKRQRKARPPARARNQRRVRKALPSRLPPQIRKRAPPQPSPNPPGRDCPDVLVMRGFVCLQALIVGGFIHIVSLHARLRTLTGPRRCLHPAFAYFANFWSVVIRHGDVQQCR